MTHLPRFAIVAALAAFVVQPASAEFLSPDFSGLSIEGVAAPNWIAGEREGAFIGMCVACKGTMVFEVKVLDDDGTGGRVASGVTTAQTYTEIGKANAAGLGKPAEYFGTEDLSFASGQGFVTQARGATGDYSSTYQLWSDGKQLLVRVYGADQAEVDQLAERVFNQAAPLTFR